MYFLSLPRKIIITGGILSFLSVRLSYQQYCKNFLMDYYAILGKFFIDARAHQLTFQQKLSGRWRLILSRVICCFTYIFFSERIN